MANRYLSMLNILFHLRCNKAHGSSQFGQMIDFYACVSLFAIWKLHLETQVQTGARNRADTRASGVWPLIGVTPDSFPPCLAAWFRGWRKAAAAAGHEFLRGHWVSFWDGHWVSEVHCPSRKGHPSCQTTLTQLLRGQPCKLSLRAWINCTRLALQINLVSGAISTLITQGLRGHTLVLLGLWVLCLLLFF